MEIKTKIPEWTLQHLLCLHYPLEILILRPLLLLNKLCLLSILSCIKTTDYSLLLKGKGEWCRLYYCSLM